MKNPINTPINTLVIRLICAAFALTLTSGLTGCATSYYDAMERKGFEKRDILVDRVTDARTGQIEARMVFASALDEFRSLIAVDDNRLEAKYDAMKNALARSEKEAKAVRTRIKAVDDVGVRLFREWESELKLYESDDLRRRSQAQRTAARTDYLRMMGAMNNAADSMSPVLSMYRDQVLFLKHNLNARALSSLSVERVEIEQRVETLNAQMDKAIAEADAFIASMK